MSGTPPPGYSSESMLAPQTAGVSDSAIQPMAGGGGGPPDGYSGESILAPQTAGVANSAIQPLQGGGPGDGKAVLDQLRSNYPKDMMDLVGTGDKSIELGGFVKMTLDSGKTKEEAYEIAKGKLSEMLGRPLQAPAGAASVTPAEATALASVVPTAAEAEAATAAAEKNPEKKRRIVKAAVGAQAQALQKGETPEGAIKAGLTAAAIVATDAAERTAREVQTNRPPRGKQTGKKSVTWWNSKRPAANVAIPAAADVAPATALPPPPHLDKKTTPVMIEYYALSFTTKYKLRGVKELMEAKQAHYERHEREWKQNLMGKIAAYSDYRQKTLWAPLSRKNAKEFRATSFVTSADSKSWQTGDSAVVTLTADMFPANKDCTLVVIPPLRGKLENLINALESLPASVRTANGVPQIVLDPGVVVVFAYPYYAPPVDLKAGKDNTAKNILFLSTFLDLFSANKDRVFALVKHEAEAYSIGQVFENYQRPRPQKGTPFVNFLEPSYVLFAVPGGDDGLNGVCVTTAGLVQEPNIPYNGPLPVPRLLRPTDGSVDVATAAGGILAVRASALNKRLDMLQGPTPGSRDKCNALKSSSQAAAVLNSVKDDKEAPYLNLPLTIVKDETGTDTADLFWLAFRFRYTAPHRPLCEDRVLLSTEEESALVTDRFVVSSDAQTQGIPTYPVLGSGADETAPPRIYQIRIPGRTNRVFQDWLSQLFTEDEAAYLNSLGFNPEILQNAFVTRVGTSWQYLLANFMSDLISTNCFLDTQMITDRRCDRVRDFMETLNNFFVENNLSRDEIQKRQDASVRDELMRYREILERKHQAEQEAAANPPTLENGKFIPASEFRDGKLIWGTLWVYDVLGETSHMKGTNVLVIKKDTGDHYYYSVRVPADQYKRDPDLLRKRIDGLRKQHQGYFFIY